jgi:hypothetical protein
MWLPALTIASTTVTDDAPDGMTPEKGKGVGVGPAGVGVAVGVVLRVAVAMLTGVGVAQGVGVAAGGHAGGAEPPPTMMEPC